MSNPESTSQSPAPVKTFRVDALSVRVYDSQATMAQDLAQLAQDYLQNLLAQQGSATVILATGNSQIEFLDALIVKGGVDWTKITLFHLDEYLGIDREHPASFRRYMRDRVENRVNPAAFHYIEGDTMEPLKECDRYTRLLQAQPIDLCCLGVGENAHLAFNEPSVASFDETRLIKLVKLDEKTREQQVNEGHFPNLSAVPQYAFTLTIPMIFSARKIFCLAPEERKAAPVRDMLKGEISTAIPASVLRRHEQAILFLDVDSASLL
ncbi:glucosamine-6-phosphate deaminase [Planktothrix sp. FACHB-1355]|uniref:Glucosamine-6-phosphate deaminase n=1 Tax=Aerosakkonema funiforme FACHB-1375 TaxID=2949571 RepID=A0A926ZI67_9CYAN|nr:MULTISPECIES: glucosamine-6-phosphate deaminase [Oscillatoriales]MBD2182917.1 glucosamine-6-phosphate deaminase [Aerosakkonema funiforme FACHB-1375]MBD3557375.1 glucosamine-6-phosphate deaminase [Planktothrix sp. FACHB-1355]